jgi:hypothetical protein
MATTTTTATTTAAIQDSKRNPTLATPRFSFAFDVASLAASQQASEQQTAVVQALEPAPERLLRTLIAKKGNNKL